MLIKSRIYSIVILSGKYLRISDRVLLKFCAKWLPSKIKAMFGNVGRLQGGSRYVWF